MIHRWFYLINFNLILLMYNNLERLIRMGREHLKKTYYLGIISTYLTKNYNGGNHYYYLINQGITLPRIIVEKMYNFSSKENRK